MNSYSNAVRKTCFNSRTREGCDASNSPCSIPLMFQFTHPRGVRFPAEAMFNKVHVSIHAPARGAIRYDAPNSAAFLFQFTHPRGVRCPYEQRVHEEYVSIHAPARGAIHRVSSTRPTTCFNSRTREGCDAERYKGVALLKFQFTHP